MARPIWSGSIVFGLVNIPIALHTAIRDKSVHLHMLNKEGDCRLHRKLYCPETGEEYDFHDTARGYEIAPDQYVLINEKELEKVKPESGKTIDILDFVDLADIDPIYYERAYYVAPTAQSGKGYALLIEALKRKKKVGIAKLIMRQKEYLVALRADDGVLIMETMHFADEVVPAEDVVGKTSKGRADSREVAMAEQLISRMERKFDPKRYKDEYRERMLDLIERKSEGKPVVLEEAPEPEHGRTMNFMKALEASLKEARGKSARAPAKKKAAPTRRRKSA